MPAGISFSSPIAAGNDPLELAIPAFARRVAFVGAVLPHRAHAAAAVAVAKAPAVLLPFDTPPPHHEWTVHLKSLHRCSTCCGRDCPELWKAGVGWNSSRQDLVMPGCRALAAACICTAPTTEMRRDSSVSATSSSAQLSLFRRELLSLFLAHFRNVLRRTHSNIPPLILIA